MSYEIAHKVWLILDLHCANVLAPEWVEKSYMTKIFTLCCLLFSKCLISGILMAVSTPLLRQIFAVFAAVNSDPELKKLLSNPHIYYARKSVPPLKSKYRPRNPTKRDKIKPQKVVDTKI